MCTVCWPHRTLDALSTPPPGPIAALLRTSRASRRNAAWGSISPGAQIAESCTAQAGEAVTDPLGPIALGQCRRRQLHSASRFAGFKQVGAADMIKCFGQEAQRGMSRGAWRPCEPPCAP